MSANMLSTISRYCPRAVWLTLLFLIVFLWTFVHLNFSEAFLASPSGKSAQIAYSSPQSAAGNAHARPPSNAKHPAASFTELAASPLKIYVPPKIPSLDPLRDIWDTSRHHTEIEGGDEDAADDVEDEFKKDQEAYHKALHCPVCVNEQKVFDIAQCPGADEIKEKLLADPAVTGCPVQPFDVKKCPNIAELNNRPQGEVPPPAPGIPGEPLLQTSTKSRPLISYVYTESPAAHRNLAFFVNHALHDAADFLFILIGATNVEKDLLPPGRSNIRITQLLISPCASSPLGSHGEILTEKVDGGKAPSETYERFILVNGEVRGPFIPRWSNECWSEAILSRLTDKVKMVGSELACKADAAPYLNTGLLALDKEGLSILLDSEAGDGINVCLNEDHDNNQAALKTNMKATRLIRDKGFEIGVLDGRWRQESEYKNIKCPQDESWFRGIGLGIAGEHEELDPWEMLFVGTDMKAGMHDHGSGLIDMVTRRVGRSGYSSYEACKGV